MNRNYGKPARIKLARLSPGCRRMTARTLLGTFSSLRGWCRWLALALTMAFFCCPQSQATEEEAQARWILSDLLRTAFEKSGLPSYRVRAAPPRVGAFLRLVELQYLAPNARSMDGDLLDLAKVIGYAIGENAHNPALPDYQNPAFQKELETWLVLSAAEFGTRDLGNKFWRRIQEGEAGMYDAEMSSVLPSRIAPEQAMHTVELEAIAAKSCLTAHSEAHWNRSKGLATCHCIQGYQADAAGAACIAVSQLNTSTVQTPNASTAPPAQPSCAGLRGSHLITRPDGSPWCACPDGYSLNSDSTACVAPQLSCAWLHGSYLTTGPDGKPLCNCPEGQLRLFPDGDTCMPAADAYFATAQRDCTSSYPGSQPTWSSEDRRWNCGCPQGLAWNSGRTACVDQLQAARQSCAARVGLHASPQFNGVTGDYACACDEGFQYRSGACIWVPATEIVSYEGVNLVNAPTGTSGLQQAPGLLPAPTLPASSAPNSNFTDLPKRAPAAPPNQVAAAPVPEACVQAVQYIASRGCSFADLVSNINYNGANCGREGFYIRPDSAQTRFVAKGPNCIFHDCYDLDKACSRAIWQCRDKKHFPCQ